MEKKTEGAELNSNALSPMGKQRNHVCQLSKSVQAFSKISKQNEGKVKIESNYNKKSWLVNFQGKARRQREAQGATQPLQGIVSRTNPRTRLKKKIGLRRKEAARIAKKTIEPQITARLLAR